MTSTTDSPPSPTGTKENKGELEFNNDKKRKKPTRPTDSTGKLLLALIGGAGAAFLLAICLLASRLDTDPGATNVDQQQFYLEEVAQGHASPALMLNGGKQNRLTMAIERMKGGYKNRSKAFEKRKDMLGINKNDNDAVDDDKTDPMKRLVNEAVSDLDAIEGAVEGKNEMPKKVDLKQHFVDMVHEHEANKPKHETMAEHFHQQEEKQAHLHNIPPLPPHLMATELYGPQIITDTLNGHPTLSGITGILQTFLSSIHTMEIEQKSSTAHQVIDAYFALVQKHLVPLENTYRHKPIFPIREDSTIFMSLGAYRDHLLGETLRQAFKNAQRPEKLFVGAVVQNCFGFVQCRTGVEVVGKNADGSPKTAVSDREPDVNGIEEFCTDPEYSKYCDAGQIRALYVNETESNGPTTARYFASKLWGGETYFMQADAHLRFAPNWDVLYEEEVKATKNFPKSVLSSYPPGFSQDDPPYKGGSKGTRLCTCEFSTSDVEHKIIRINTGNNCKGEEAHPTQIAYIAAGFFFARAEFLVDVPFDPYLPWCFMGEEIALSLRAWTNGWDIYAPRKNLIAHQYRPGRMGLPKFWENVGRVFGRPGPGFNTQLQTITLQRIKHMVGYEEATMENLDSHGNSIVMTDYEYYGPGEVRSMDAFLEHTRIDVKHFKCGFIDWCNQCTLD